MMNATLEILPSLQEIPHDRKGHQANNVTLLSRRFLGCQLEVSIAESGRLRGWVTAAGKTREVKLKGLPSYLTLKRVTQLLKQSYLKFQKETIEVLPSGLGGMQHADTCKEQVPLENDIYSLVEAVANKKKRILIRETIAMLLQNNPVKKELNVRYKQIGIPGAQALATALKVNQSVQTLDLMHNQISDAGTQALATALKINQSVQTLNLFGNGIGVAGAQALGTTLQVNQSIQSLNFGNNQIGTGGAQALGVALQVNQSLQSLYLYDNQIGDTGIQALRAALQVNDTLESLNLQHNQIGKVGAQALRDALEINHTLQTLILGINQISDQGVLALAAALQVNQSIQKLDLRSNQIGDEGAKALGDALQVNQSIQTLILETNQIGDQGTQALGTALKVNQSVQKLNLNENEIGDRGALALAETLQVNHTLQKLVLAWNKIKDTGTQALVIALEKNQTLQQLDLNGNQIENMRLINRLKTLLQANKQIATTLQKQIEPIQNFLDAHQNEEGILLQNLPQLKELLQKWHTDSKDLIPSLQKILQKSGRTNLNDRYKEKLEGIVKDLTNRLHELWLESFEKKVAALSNEYVMGKESAEERNVDLGYALFETWLTFLGTDCPNWVEDHLQSLIPFGVLLDIAESGEKKDLTDLTDARSLFERVLSFRNESKDSLFSLTNQSQKS